MIVSIPTDSSVVSFDSTQPPGKGGAGVAVFQAKISGTGTVQLQGSLLPVGHADQVWTDLLPSPFSTSGAANVTIFPYYRVQKTGSPTYAGYLLI